MVSKSPEKIFVKVDNTWYNAKSFADKHPGGSQVLDYCHLEDVTDQFYSLHSKRAEKWLRALPKVSSPNLKAELEKHNKTEPQRSEVSVSFEKFRKQLEKEGWFERSVWGDIFYLSSILVLYVLGVVLGNVPVEEGAGIKNYSWMLGSFLLGLGMQQAGWISHDYGHMRGRFCRAANYMTGLVYNGFSVQWWARKHNGLHHVYTNQVNIDPDINNEPVLFLSIPKDSHDVWYRKYQHLYYHLVFSLLYFSWRLQSIQYVVQHKLHFEGTLMAIGYALMFYLLPVKVIISSILIGGWLVAEIVTATHQDEEFLKEKSFDFIMDQFKTTRDVVLNSAVGNWLWGGMQFQLVHHLFPKMPKYYYPACSKRLLAWCQENNVEYKRSSAWEMFFRNYNVYKRNSVTANEFQKSLASMEAVSDFKGQLDECKKTMEDFIRAQTEELKRNVETRCTSGTESAKNFVDQRMEKVLKQVETTFSEFSVM